MKRVVLEHHYDAPSRAVWELCTDFAALEEVSRPVVRFRGLSRGHLQEGVIEVEVSLFGLLPWQPYRMEVLRCDDDAMEFQSSEHGMGVERWAHHLKVSPEGAGARIDEEIEIEAGWKEPFVAAWARMLYRRRHPIRQKLLAQEVAA